LKREWILDRYKPPAQGARPLRPQQPFLGLRTFEPSQPGDHCHHLYLLDEKFLCVKRDLEFDQAMRNSAPHKTKKEAT
jgi:hypothetical protein